MPHLSPIAGPRSASEWECCPSNCVDMVKLAVITFRPIVKFRTNQALPVDLGA